MPAKDIYHPHVRNALIKDGWTVTHDPLNLKWGKKDMYADFGAEKLFAAEKEERKIAVEVKSFVGASIIKDLRDALGQYVLYLFPKYLKSQWASFCCKIIVSPFLSLISAPRRSHNGFLRQLP